MISYLKTENSLIKVFFFGSILYLPISLILSSLGFVYLNVTLKLGLISIILAELLFFKLHENLKFKLIFFLIFSIFLLKNLYNFSFWPSIFVSFSGFIAFCSLLVCFKKFNLGLINKKALTITSLISIIIILLYGKIWHLIFMGNTDNFYRLVMPYINPNFTSSALVINLLIFNLLCFREKYFFFVNICFAVALALLGSRTGSLSYIFISFFCFFFKNFDKKMIIVIVISFISCFYSFHSRGDFMADNFDLKQERESLSRFEQFVQAGILFLDISANKSLVVDNISSNFDRNFNITKNNFLFNKTESKNKFDLQLSSIISSESQFPYIFIFGNSFGLHTNNYYNFYSLLSKISSNTENFHLTFFPRHETTTYNTLTYLLYNGGLMMVFFFFIIMFIMPIINTYKNNFITNKLILSLCYFKLFLLILTLGGSFPLTELTPYSIILIIFLFNFDTIQKIDN